MTTENALTPRTRDDRIRELTAEFTESADASETIADAAQMLAKYAHSPSSAIAYISAIGRSVVDLAVAELYGKVLARIEDDVDLGEALDTVRADVTENLLGAYNEPTSSSMFDNAITLARTKAAARFLKRTEWASAVLAKDES